MIKIFFCFSIAFFFLVITGYGHGSIQGKVLDSNSKTPLASTFIKIANVTNRITYAEEDGYFHFKHLPPGFYSLQFSALGYKTMTDTVEVSGEGTTSVIIYMEEDVLELPAVELAPRGEFSQTTVSSLDFQLRPHNSTQDLLRVVPGLFIAQHAGGGKAEQLFLRGFDVDHGTDVAISVDGMPVNMVSHAHGQGYADLHFIIPETIDNLSFSKGSYDSRSGNFHTAGAVKFKTKNYVRQNVLKYERGIFNTERGLALINILPGGKDGNIKNSAYVAGEYFLSRLYFDAPQDLDRYNLFFKYNQAVTRHSDLSVSLSAFSSSWDASGQIPQRAVDNRAISWFGSIDPTEGGKTTRKNFNSTYTTYFHNGASLSQQLYLVNYTFSLFSNFTFFKEDTVNGDQIHQSEHRNLFGYNAAYKNSFRILSVPVEATAGGGYRGDRIDDIGLARTKQRGFLNHIKKGDIKESNISSYAHLNFLFSERTTMNMGLRYDHLFFKYQSKLGDTAFAPDNAGVLSPKFNLYYMLTPEVQWFASAGYGFHSNDARVSVMRTNITTLPRSKSVDVGANFRLRKNLLVSTTLWYMHLQSEFSYVGDDGFIEPSGSTNRHGIEVSGRCQILRWLFADFDFTYSKARYSDMPEGENYIPLAPAITAIGGIGVNGIKGFSGSLRFRHLGERPATEDYSVKASGYFLADAVIHYQIKKFAFSASAENLFNAKWREAQFATESRLPGEADPVTENHFTPGTPFFIKGGISYLF